MSEDKGPTNSFGRRTWDRGEYAKRAQERYLNKGKPDEQLKKSKYEFHKDREDQFRKIDEMNTVSFVSAQQSATTGKRGRGIGFYCETCDLTFKNDLELVDHLNSKQHFSNAGVEYVDNKNITLQMVIDRVERLAREREKQLLESEDSFDLKERIELRRKFEAGLAERRRAKKLKRKEKAQEKRAKSDAVDNDGNDDMMNTMGFKGFGTTKN